MLRSTLNRGMRIQIPTYSSYSNLLRPAGAYGLIGAFLTHSVLGRVVKPVHQRKDFHVDQASRYSRLFLKCLSFHVDCNEPEVFTGSENYLIVANHQSYLDALVMASLSPAIFVTSVEMQNSPFVGLVAEMGASLFIERRNKDKLADEIKMVARTLEEGNHVVLFPEGTSTNGHEIKPFKVSFFSAAQQAMKKVLPVAISYEKINGENFSLNNCDQVCWYGKMDFFPHLKGLMKLQSVNVRVKVGNPLDPREHADRISLALAAQEEVGRLYWENRRPPSKLSTEGHQSTVDSTSG